MPFLWKDQKYSKNKVIGVILSEHREITTIKEFSIEQTKDKQDDVENSLLDEAKFTICYPWFAYSRFTDLIIGNLADTSYPQKIIKLPKDLKIQSICENNFADRIVIVTWNIVKEIFHFHEIVLPRPFQQLRDRNSEDF